MLVAIGIVVRLDDENDGIQYVGFLLEEEIAKQGERGFLPFHFTGVDVALDVGDGSTEATGFFRRRDQRARRDDVPQVPTGGRLAKRSLVDPGSEQLEGVDEKPDVFVPGPFRLLRDTRSTFAAEQTSCANEKRAFRAA